MGILALVDGHPAVREGKGDACMNCQHCLAVCPEGALTLNGVVSAELPLLSDMPIPPPNELANLLRSRRSVRQFADTSIPRGEIEELLESLKYVPTGCNVRHLTFTVVDGKAKMDACRRRVLEALYAREATLPDFLKGVVAASRKNPELDAFFRGAPHLLIVKSGAGAVTPQQDCDAAIAYFDLLAQSFGLGTTWCGFLKIIVDAVPEVADIFGIPRGAPFYAMVFGEPMVDYTRCVDRSSTATIEWL